MLSRIDHTTRYLKRLAVAASTTLAVSAGVFAASAQATVYSVVGTGGTLHVRTAASLSAPIVANLTDGTAIDIVCQTRGDQVVGSTMWDKIDSPVVGYVADWYTTTPAVNNPSPGLPGCETSQPPPTQPPPTQPPPTQPGPGPARGGSGSGFCAPFGGLSTSHVNIDNVYPCANPNISDSFGYQCVEFSSRFEYAVHGLAPVGGSGRQLVRNLQARYGVPVSSPGIGRLPRAGDVISMWGPGQEAVGHTGVVATVHVNAAGNGTITIYDENGAISGGRSVGVTGGIKVTNWRIAVTWPYPVHYTEFDWTVQA